MLEHLPDAVGHLLHDTRAGLDQCAYSLLDLRTGQGAIRVQSLAFADHAPLPERCTADGPGVSPPLSWTGVPAAAGSVVLLVEDADAPTPKPLVHAIVVGLPAGDGALAEAAISGDALEADPAIEVGRNSFLRSGWLPPDPPPGHGVHRYVFQVYALAPGATFSSTPGRDALMEALRAHALASGCLIGTYERPDGAVRTGVVDVVPTPG